MKRRFGILTFASGPFSEIVHRWREAERLGFDSAWVVDAVSYPGLVDYEPWTLLAALARETPRMRIGTLITQVPFRHLTILAAQTLTLDHLSDGRIELGIAGGFPGAESAAVGAQDWSPSERVARLGEQADPLSSIEAFDEFVGRYAEIGMEEFVFYWPPLANVRQKEPVSALQQATYERIAEQRIAPLHRVGS